MQKKFLLGLVMSLFCSLLTAQSNRSVKYFNKAREAVANDEYQKISFATRQNPRHRPNPGQWGKKVRRGRWPRWGAVRTEPKGRKGSAGKYTQNTQNLYNIPNDT